MKRAKKNEIVMMFETQIVALRRALENNDSNRIAVESLAKSLFKEKEKTEKLLADLEQKLKEKLAEEEWHIRRKREFLK